MPNYFTIHDLPSDTPNDQAEIMINNSSTEAVPGTKINISQLRAFFGLDVKHSILTEEEYAALSEKDPNTVYVVKGSDGRDISFYLGGLYLLAERAVYDSDGNAIATTYADRNLSNLLKGLSNVICTTAPGTVSTASAARPAVIVENYDDGAGNWYRVWSDGWVEQGGHYQVPAGGYNVTFLKPYADTNYTVLITQKHTSGATGLYGFVINATNLGFIGGAAQVGGQYDWYACGKGA